LVDQAFNLVMSLVEPIDQVVDLIPSSINLSLPSESETKAVDPIPSSVNPTLPLESESQAVDLLPLVDLILPSENETQVANLISSSVSPTLLLESKPDNAHVFLIDTESTMPGAIPPSLVEPPTSNEAIHFD
jgi:hypothetical protein